MKIQTAFTALVLLAGCATVGPTAHAPANPDAGKNCYDVRYRELPADVTEEMRDHPEDWNFNFRPYGKQADWLISDPAVQRNVMSGGSSERNLTALNVTCDDNGFTVLVFCGEKALKSYLAETNALPSPTLEMFVKTGDADNDDVIVPERMTSGTMRDTREYPDLMPGRHFRNIRPYMTCEEKVLENAFLCRITYDWAAFHDELPVFAPAGRDNFWRLSVIRWTEGGQTWGGQVHKGMRAGYIRWPDFTPGQRTAILKRTLLKGWDAFNEAARKPDVIVGPFPNPQIWKVPFRDAEWAVGRTSPNFNDNPLFRSSLEKVIARCRELGPRIAAFESMSGAEQESFYRLASDRLFNFRRDVERAYRDYAEDRIFREGK